MSLEQIVRPFQSPRPLNTRRVIPSSAKKEPQTAGVTWGKAGKLPVAAESDPEQPAAAARVVIKKSDKRKVTKLETEKVRIEQAGKPENWVEVERVKKMTLSPVTPAVFSGPTVEKANTVQTFARKPGDTDSVAEQRTTTTGASESFTLDPEVIEIDWAAVQI